MALDSTVGGASANSYVSRAEAVAYFASGMHKENADWTALAGAAQDEWLIAATLVIDSQRIKGGKYDINLTSGVPDQRLKFPRAQDYDDGTTFIPYAVKQATYEQAMYMLQGGTGTTRQQLQAQGVTSVTIGDVSESYDGSGGSGSGQLAPVAKRLLMNAGLLQYTGRISF